MEYITPVKMAHRNGFSRDDRDLDRDKEREFRDEKAPVHIIEHLATFSVSQEMGILYPNDGMRRLRQMEQTNGIWSQKMQLCLDYPWVLILDESGAIVEKFPVNAIQDPTAFMSTEPMDMYNNILVFIIADSSQPSHSPEMQMHIFQCQSISAQDLVEDLKALRMGKAISRSRKSSIPAHKSLPPAVVSPSRDNTRDYFNHRSDSELTENNDDSSSTTSEKYERDVSILNHCFDDIEKFIARLQHSAAALKELDRKRKNRRNKKRDIGDGMLTMRAKPPPEKEFVDIFQKFKLSFNLLAKLKAHIHDPNAPELVHFLFTPLALIVESSHDYYFDQHIPQNVTAPLLTREAINLLMNCVTSKETELWHSLGNAWLVPKDQYRGHVPSYHPVFMDGWSPEYPVDEPDTADKIHGPDDDDSDSNFIPPLGESTAKSDISLDSIEIKGEEKSFGAGQERFLEELHSRGAHIVQVTYPRTANNDKELTVERGEFLEILDSSRKWWKARNSKGAVAHVPNTIVTQYHSSSLSPHLRNSIRREDSPPHSRYPGQIPGDEFRIQTKPAEAIRSERLEDQLQKHVAPPVPPPPPPPNGALPPPPPPPIFNNQPPEAPPTERPISRQPSQSSPASDAVQEELNSVFSVMKDKIRPKPLLDIKSTPEKYINNKSSAAEVQEWLKVKDFDAGVCGKFKGVAGSQIMAMDKEDLEKVCGQKIGGRLYSFLLVQKSVSGYKTYRSAEFHKLLQKQRQKLEKKPEDILEDE
ncbi:epidermal growth factor receptor kinase substrate 8-like [Anthonomus grandis grandis]|uniref:epidermal growth factor receptor kinase substrate 8-like n=1 Tax=Anthonomus grandis grandis TaxID=2921223 RepID=UPI002166A25C|nr:epidermal growth factor receptor kinase substrate 8-like [Anthonomus grandis grandis]